MDDIAIFWDYENCPVPSNMSGYPVVNTIRSLALTYGSIKTLKAYLEISEQTFLSRALNLRSELQSSGVSLVDCPHNGRKEVADKMIIVDMLAHAIDNPAPSTVMIITGDRDFAYAMSILRLRGYRVILITLSNAHPSLTAQSSFWLDWVTEILEPAAASTGFSKQVRSDFNPSDRNAYHERALANKASDHPNSFHKSHEAMVQSPPKRTNADLGQLHQSATQRRATVNGMPSDLSLDSGQIRNRNAMPRVPVQNTGNPLYSPLPNGTFNNLTMSTPLQIQLSQHPIVIGQIPESSPQASAIKDSVGHLPPNVTSKIIQYSNASTSTYHSPVPLKHSKALQTSPAPSPIFTKDISVPFTHENDFSSPSPRDTFSVRPSSAPSIKAILSQNSGHDPGASSAETPANTNSKAKTLYKSMISELQLSIWRSGGTLDTSNSNIVKSSNFGAKTMESTSSLSSVVTTDKSAAPTTTNADLPTSHVNKLPLIVPPSISVPPTVPPINTATPLVPTVYIPSIPVASSVPSTNSATPPRPTALPFSPSMTQPSPVVPKIFKILVESLQKHMLDGKPKPSRSTVAVEISKNGSTYKKAGVTTFKQYAALAEQQGIIELGVWEGDAWMSLCPKWRNNGIPKSSQ